MFNFKQNLDKWIESTPWDSYSSQFLEEVTDQLTEQFFEINEDFVLDSILFVDWCEKLEGHHPKVAAEIIERAFSIYCNKVKPLK